MEKMKSDISTIRKGVTIELALVGILLTIVGSGAFWAASIQGTVQRMGEDISAMRKNQEIVLEVVRLNDKRLTVLESKGK